MHAHSQMLAARPVLPPTIIDQIRLWEIERDRFEFTDSVLYNQFLSQNEFEIIRDYAKVNMKHRQLLLARILASITWSGGVGYHLAASLQPYSCWCFHWQSFK